MSWLPTYLNNLIHDKDFVNYIIEKNFGSTNYEFVPVPNLECGATTQIQKFEELDKFTIKNLKVTFIDKKFTILVEIELSGVVLVVKVDPIYKKYEKSQICTEKQQELSVHTPGGDSKMNITNFDFKCPAIELRCKDDNNNDKFKMNPGLENYINTVQGNHINQMIKDAITSQFNLFFTKKTIKK